MGAQQLAGFCIEHGLDHALRFTKRDGLAVADEGKATNFDIVAQFFCLRFGVANTGDLRVAIGTTGNAFRFNRMRMLTCDQLGNHDAFVRGFMRQPRCASNIADGVEPIDIGTAELVGNDMGAVNFDAQFFKAKTFDIANNTNRRNHSVEVFLDHFATGFDMRGDLALGAVELLDHGFLHDLHALLGKGFLREGADLRIFNRQDTIHNLDHSRIGAQRVVEACELDTDRARADHQQLLRHARRLQRVFVGPDQITIRL